MNRLFDVPAIPTGDTSNEWYTPAKYIEAAREVMGGIDLDPASCAFANRTVKATRYYDQAVNGLMQPWSGRVWLNPPFSRIEGRSGIEPWANKLVRSYCDGDITQAVLLVPGQTGSHWFAQMWDFPICFGSSHIHFYRPGQKDRSQRDCTVFVYLGPNEAQFVEVFSQFGRIAKAIDAPSAKAINLDLWTREEVEA